MQKVGVALGLLLVAAGCGSDPVEPVVPTGQLLSIGSPTKDEDPSVLRAQDGRLFVAWFSDRGGNPDIYITSTVDGTGWTGPFRVTTSTGGDFNPSLIQDEQGVFHLAWFRWEAPFRGHIWYNHSVDGLTWNPGTEVQVTTAADVDDWVPTLVRTADGTLLVYFVSEIRDTTNPTSEIYVARKGPAASSWDAPVSLTAINSATEHDHLPFAARTGNTITLVWVRHDTSQPLPWMNPKSDLFLSTSTEGLDWAPPTRITQTVGNVVNLFPGLYQRSGGGWFCVWLSTPQGPTNPKVFELPVAGSSTDPAALVENTALPGGYSHRIAPTSTPGRYLGVWVQGPEGAQDIYYRFFSGPY